MSEFIINVAPRFLVSIPAWTFQESVEMFPEQTFPISASMINEAKSLVRG